MILFIDACVRTHSRTRQLAGRLLAGLSGAVKTAELSSVAFPKVDEAFIAWRNEKTALMDFSSPVFDFARDFAAADTIVIAAPFWDLSFPSLLKQYLEQICVVGLTFRYENDRPKGLCRAKKLYYVTTAGGYILSADFGYGYIAALAKTFFGIRDCEWIKAEGLDISGADERAILREAEDSITGSPQDLPRKTP